jgi:uncharacterized membrane protein YfcA
MDLSPLQDLLSVLSGVVVGFSLGLVGGGGSILAVPLMIYVVGVQSPHLAIGSSATAVAVNAAIGLAGHARAGSVKWRCALVFAAAGIVGAWLGSTAGKAFDGQRLLSLFAVLMLVIAGIMLKRRSVAGNPGVRLGRDNLWKLLAFGLAAGMLSGFFGIGGGFLIVPGLIAATGMPMLNAVASSLVAVTAFGVTTAANYQLSGLIDWQLTLLFIVGGFLGSLAGTRIARHLALRRGLLNTVFAGIIVLVAIYMLVRSLGLV